MTLGRFDVCHGDADGLCAIRQWRLNAPASTTLITGAKRDIGLLQRVLVHRAREVLVMDLSVQRNRAALQALLKAGVRVQWFDHHACDPMPEHALLQSVIDPSPQTCTSLLVDAYIHGRQRAWALVGAYGDNLIAQAETLADASGFDATQRASLRSLGETMTYNACSGRAEDGCVDPHEVYRRMTAWPDPLVLLARDPVLQRLARLRRDDLARAEMWPVQVLSSAARMAVLPDTAWSRRVAGTLADQLMRASPAQSHAVLLEQPDASFRVSVRRALATAAAQATASAASGLATEADRTAAVWQSAEALCRRFGGGGRVQAAGIDRLAALQREPFEQAFTDWAGRSRLSSLAGVVNMAIDSARSRV